MTETKTITITAYRTPDGVPTCMSAEGACQFYGWAKGGQACHAHHGRALTRGTSAFVFPPRDGCIVWPMK